MNYKAELIPGGWLFNSTKLTHPDQPSPDWKDAVGNETDALRNTAAVFRSPALVDMLADALNGLNPSTPADIATRFLGSVRHGL